jgi:RNA polymerase sigma-70 factor, ECF subfamily
MTPEQAFDQYHQAVYGFAYRLTRRTDLADDLTQECFLALVRAPLRFDEERGSMKTHLFAIARNLAFKHE